MSTPDPGLQFALLKVSEMAERLALAEATMGGLIDGVSDLRELVEEHQKLLEKTSKIIAELMPPDKPDGPDEPPYVVQPMTHWWTVDADGRGKTIDHIRAWVDDVYRPHYGHLAERQLAPCWEQHELCLVHLDFLSELHSLLFFSRPSAAILNAHAEYNTRLLPASVELMRAECSKCEHNRRPAANGSSWRGSRS